MNQPLYITGINLDGVCLIGGVFKMQDSFGFPIDASFEECKQKGWVVDWLEAMADCWLNDCLKFDSFVRQASLLAGEDLGSRFSETGASIMALNPDFRNFLNPVDEVCKLILSNKRLFSVSPYAISKSPLPHHPLTAS